MCTKSVKLVILIVHNRSFEQIYYYAYVAKISYHRDQFWGDVARERILWREPFHTVSDCDLKEGKVSWFLGGKLNVSG